MSVDRRSHPRYPVDMKVRVRPLEIGEEFAADATNLSRSSVQVVCESDLVMTLVRNTQPPYICNLAFEIPGQPLPMKGQILTHRRISQQHYVLVFLFKQLDEQQEAGLGQLLSDVMPASM